MASDVASCLAAAGRVADMDGILQIEMLVNGAGVGGVMVHVVPVADLGRATMASAIMGDDAVALVEEVEHLRIPVVGGQGPAVMEGNRLSALRTPVVVEISTPSLVVTVLIV
jgi:hypothetical protein